MSREDSPGWQQPHSQPHAGLGEDVEPVEVELEEPLHISDGQSGPFSGSLSDVRLYNRGLSDTQVAAIFERQRM